MKRIITIVFLSVVFSSCQKESFTPNQINDIVAANTTTEEKVAPIPLTTICGKVWMAKNLEVTRYRNGDKILKVSSPGEWKNLTVGAWCWYFNDSVNFGSYGKLYNGYAITDPRGLAPEGYHIPTNDEVLEIQNTFGGPYLTGNELKSTTGWDHGNYGYNGTNSTGFNGLPGGYRLANGNFNAVGYIGNWWVAPTPGLTDIKMFYLHSAGGYMTIAGGDLKAAQNVRCVKDY